MKRTGAILLLSFTTSLALAQSSVSYQAKKDSLSEIELQRWSHLDLLKDSIPGMSVDKAYNELLKDKKGNKVIVAVIDSGVDKSSGFETCYLDKQKRNSKQQKR